MASKKQSSNLGNVIIIALMLLVSYYVLRWLLVTRSQMRTEGFGDGGMPDVPVSPDHGVLVRFHRKGCPACKAFVPVWQQLEQMIPRDRMVSIDTDHDEIGLGDLHGVVGVPTVQFVTKWGQKGIEYVGPREAPFLADFYMQHA